MNKIKRLTMPVLLAALSVLVAVPSCATLSAAEKALPGITSDIAEVTLYTGVIKSTVDSYFVGHPNQALQATIDKDIDRVSLAAAAVQSLARAGVDMQSGQGASALADLFAAYTNILAVTKTFGVTTASTSALAKASPGGVTVPAARDLHLFRLNPKE
jgi:hypothetical protein